MSWSSQRRRARPACVGWTWLSPKPGRDGAAAELDHASARSRRAGARPGRRPTATMRPPRTASASAQVLAASAVKIRPPVRTRSARSSFGMARRMTGRPPRGGRFAGGPDGGGRWRPPLPIAPSSVARVMRARVGRRLAGPATIGVSPSRDGHAGSRVAGRRPRAGLVVRRRWVAIGEVAVAWMVVRGIVGAATNHPLRAGPDDAGVLSTLALAIVATWVGSVARAGWPSRAHDHRAPAPCRLRGRPRGLVHRPRPRRGRPDRRGPGDGRAAVADPRAARRSRRGPGGRHARLPLAPPPGPHGQHRAVSRTPRSSTSGPATGTTSGSTTTATATGSRRARSCG